MSESQEQETVEVVAESDVEDGDETGAVHQSGDENCASQGEGSPAKKRERSQGGKGKVNIFECFLV